MNHILILFVAMAFLLSLGTAFAVDDNSTQTISQIDDDAISLEEDSEISLSCDDNSDSKINSAEEDVAAAKVDNSGDDLNDGIIQTIKMNGVVKRVNGGVWYSATFYDNEGNPLKNQEMWFTVDTDSIDYGYSASTDSNGVAILKIALKNGNHKITAYNIAMINGDTFDNASANIKVFNVLTGDKDIIMYYDGGNTYKVRVFGDDGKPVKGGQKVTFDLNGKKYVKKTDKNGYAKIKITNKPGYYYISAKYKDFQVANIILVKNVLKPIEIKSRAVKPTLKFKVKFLGKNKKNKVIKVKFNKKTYKAKTNKKGIATFKLKTPKKLGAYKVTVSYKKSKATLTYTKFSV